MKKNFNLLKIYRIFWDFENFVSFLEIFLEKGDFCWVKSSGLNFVTNCYGDILPPSTNQKFGDTLEIRTNCCRNIILFSNSISSRKFFCNYNVIYDRKILSVQGVTARKALPHRVAGGGACYPLLGPMGRATSHNQKTF